ncbi:MAG: stage II sporulation protein M [Gammaproteobacteria bacterium]|nr:MAG: stage II sporulation protein M [Gammaproteobacteria bacterium]
MRQKLFEQKFELDWIEFRTLLDKRKSNDLDSKDSEKFIDLYRKISHHYSLAIDRGYGQKLVTQLHNMVMEAHKILYRKKDATWRNFIKFLIYSFPVAVRKEWRYLLVSLSFFAIPLFATGIVVYIYPEAIYSFMSESQVKRYENMYDPKERKESGYGKTRNSDTDLKMFGHYIQNNTGIGLKTFGMGLIFAIGTIITLLFNGISIGVVAGHLTLVGFTDTFYPFVIGHGSFELTAIVLAGCAGLKIGMACLMPGMKTRLESLKTSAKDAMPIVYGMMLMFIIAAFIEAFWSSSTAIPNSVKYSVGSFLWVLVIGYLVFCGRNYGYNQD